MMTSSVSPTHEKTSDVTGESSFIKIQINLSDQLGKDVMELQSDLGMENIEDLTTHAWNVLRYLMKTFGSGRFTLSHEAIHWISQPAAKISSQKSFQKTPPLSHEEGDTRILKDIHRLIDNNHLEQALTVAHILKILKSHGLKNQNSPQVKTEMLLAAAETFAAECEPEHAAQLISDAAKETINDTTDKK
ncbi:MAG: hypothetical protein ABIU05_22070 [Nitrospirales bacterium]